jgi:plasmid stability protein
MSAITVRGLAEETRSGLRQLAATQGRSVEALARDTLAALAAGKTLMAAPAPPAGMAEQSMPWPVPGESSFEALSGALAGRIHVAEGTDLTAPAGEGWDAESRSP